ncbi:8-oxo-dGTP diphosphatase MutT [Arenicella xantha]|uniref:8-oxo-dGTP diphosphatase n=1 Tax=Arenicella xantha TaxID=644221 RepID=A0A395JLN7_9GAMM|nr:8-oxo-dGTP diphosphatase MutT [Arenicella xantha]RBP49878.1 8-oxo-dGTPase [Arenicella xantha]
MNRIVVAVGIVYDELGRLLVGQRVVRDRYFNKWEFPGGKLEDGESVEQALVREFQEEVGIQITASEPLIEVNHEYPDRSVRLLVRTVLSYQGQVRSLEGQALAWVTLDELDELDFLQGNQAIIDALRGV